MIKQQSHGFEFGYLELSNIVDNFSEIILKFKATTAHSLGYFIDVFLNDDFWRWV